MTWDPSAARAFVHGNARVLERRVYATLFEGADPSGVIAALGAYRNTDGGFGHGLEPDKRAPGSQPLDVEIAFEAMVAVGAHDSEFVETACEWLTTVAVPSGAVPILLPSIAGFPRAGHWERTDYEPGLNPTAAIAAHAHALGCRHPWIDRSTDHCFSELEAGRVPGEAHELLGLSKLVQAAPDRQRALRIAPLIAAAIPEASFMKLEPGEGTYGVTPLEFAPAPHLVARSWFHDDLLAAHIDELERQQQTDGGWPISWDPPSDASRLDWRGIRTVMAVSILSAYGRSG